MNRNVFSEEGCSAHEVQNCRELSSYWGKADRKERKQRGK